MSYIHEYDIHGFLSGLSLGVIDPSSSSSVQHEETEEEKRHKELLASVPPISSILNLHDFESIARRVLPPKAWAYYSSAADDEITLRENRGAYLRYVGIMLLQYTQLAHLISSSIWFRPQILVDVEKVDFSTTILGQRSSMPIYIVSLNLLVYSFLTLQPPFMYNLKSYDRLQLHLGNLAIRTGS